jgi:4-hydroxy-tetrahydrodipicolinate reductase
MKRLKLAIVGMGKMGRAVDELSSAHGFDVVARFGRGGAAIDAASLAGADVAIEFTEPTQAAANIRALVSAGCPVVSGTTGWGHELDAIANEVGTARGALFWESNFSMGAHLFFSLVASAAEALSASPYQFAAHLVETHHAAKKDAPSGTARTAAERAASNGLQVPITSVRVGSVPGVHDLLLDAPYEQLRIEHVVRDRRVFASGALSAARWIIGRKGVFRMADMTASSGQA